MNPLVHQYPSRLEIAERFALTAPPANENDTCFCGEDTNDDTEHVAVRLPCDHICGRKCLHKWCTTISHDSNKCPKCPSTMFDDGRVDREFIVAMIAELQEQEQRLEQHGHQLTFNRVHPTPRDVVHSEIWHLRGIAGKDGYEMHGTWWEHFRPESKSKNGTTNDHASQDQINSKKQDGHVIPVAQFKIKSRVELAEERRRLRDDLTEEKRQERAATKQKQRQELSALIKEQKRAKLIALEEHQDSRE